MTTAKLEAVKNRFPGLTKERRFEVCIHEAAHAVIFSLNHISWVYSIEVAPEGATEWVTTGSCNNQRDDLWGICRQDESTTIHQRLIRWDEENGDYVCHVKFEQEYYKLMLKLAREKHSIMNPKEKFSSKHFKNEYWRNLRAFIAGTLAGGIAEDIFNNEEIDAESLYYAGVWACDPTYDVTIAGALCRFLPQRHFLEEFEHLVKETERTLRRPELWDRVIKLAKALEREGKIEDEELEQYLPEPASNWPPSPGERLKTVA